MPSRRHGSPGSATSKPQKDPAALRNWLHSVARQAEVAHSALRMTAARTNHPDRRRLARARTNRRFHPKAAVWDGRRFAAAYGSAAIAKDRWDQMRFRDRMASAHRLVLVVKKKKAPAAGA